MRKILAYVVILLCVATVTNHPQRRYHASSKIFWEYMRTFEREYGVDLQNTRIYMGLPTAGPRLLAYCHLYDKSIEVHVHAWNRINSSTKEYVVFHELAHCVMDIRHTFGVIGTRFWNSENHCPTTMMHPTVRTKYIECFEEYREFYLDSLRILRDSQNGE